MTNLVFAGDVAVVLQMPGIEGGRGGGVDGALVVPGGLHGQQRAQLDELAVVARVGHVLGSFGGELGRRGGVQPAGVVDQRILLRLVLEEVGADADARRHVAVHIFQGNAGDDDFVGGGRHTLHALGEDGAQILAQRHLLAQGQFGGGERGVHDQVAGLHIAERRGRRGGELLRAEQRFLGGGGGFGGGLHRRGGGGDCPRRRGGGLHARHGYPCGIRVVSVWWSRSGPTARGRRAKKKSRGWVRWYVGRVSLSFCAPLIYSGFFSLYTFRLHPTGSKLRRAPPSSSVSAASPPRRARRRRGCSAPPSW